MKPDFVRAKPSNRYVRLKVVGYGVKSAYETFWGTTMKRKAFCILGLSVLLLATPLIGSAQTDRKILTVSGRINKTNSADKKTYVFSFADLQKLGDKKIKATTRYLGKDEFAKGEYVGPLIRDILKAVDAAPDAKTVAVVAIDGYQKEIPLTDLERWDVITAHTLNGKRLTVETKGPLWIMYPIDKHPKELLNNETTTKLVWSLTGLVVQ